MRDVSTSLDYDKMTHPGLNLSPEKKIAGVLVPLFALRGERRSRESAISVRCREFIDWAARNWIQACPTPAHQRDRGRQQPVQRDQRNGDRANHAAPSAKLVTEI